MHLSQRPLSANTYALPLIWYRCHSLDLREGDFTKLTSTVKSWIFADCLEKPEELATYKRREEGGLGLHHVRSKSLAMLIRSFIETATGDKFVQSLYHQALFQWHVLLHRDFVNPGRPPYYSDSFFSTIREVMLGGTLNVLKMSSAQWYRVLLEKNVTMESVTGKQTARLMKPEKSNPEVNWQRTWS